MSQLGPDPCQIRTGDTLGAQVDPSGTSFWLAGEKPISLGVGLQAPSPRDSAQPAPLERVQHLAGESGGLRVAAQGLGVQAD